MNDENVPDLGGGVDLTPKRFGAQMAGLARTLDENGAIVATHLRRDHFLDGEQLIEEIRQMIRGELKAFAVRMGRSDLADTDGVEGGSD